MDCDILIAMKNKYSEGVTTLSTDPFIFSLEEAAKSKLVKKFSLTDEDSFKAIATERRA